MLKGEPGSMMFLTSGMKQTIGCGECWARCCTGEECCTVNFINGGDLNAYAALTPNFPTAKVVPVDLSAPEVGGKLICQRGSYM